MRGADAHFLQFWCLSAGTDARPRLRRSTINAILSLSVIALNIVYITPTICRLTVGRKRFRPGPFTLGKWAYPIGALGALYVGFAVCIFSLPFYYPVYYRTLNYAGICWCVREREKCAMYRIFLTHAAIAPSAQAGDAHRVPDCVLHARVWRQELVPRPRGRDQRPRVGEGGQHRAR